MRVGAFQTAGVIGAAAIRVIVQTLVEVENEIILQIKQLSVKSSALRYCTARNICKKTTTTKQNKNNKKQTKYAS